MRIAVAVLVLVALIIAVGWLWLFPQYEYAMLAVPDAYLRDALAVAGHRGWDVVSMRRATNPAFREEPMYEALMRRRVLPFRATDGAELEAASAKVTSTYIDKIIAREREATH